MELHKLQKISNKKKRRVGQGHGSGRVKTGGRGTKGQNARSTRSLTFEGGALPLIKRLPFRRGKGKNKVFKRKPVVINVKALNLLPKNSIVDTETLIKHNIVSAQDAKTYGVKILGDGDMTIPLTVKVQITKGAAAKIEKAGGKIENTGN
jgi:large subunit ribosomal protein L15